MVAGVMVAASLAWGQWEPTARLGLSAAPDSYVPTIRPEVGAPFTLYVVLTGLEGVEILPFDLAAVSWVVHTECCGDSPVGVTSLVYAGGVVAAGDPYEMVETTTADCPGGHTVLLATATFEWLLEGEDQFLLSAGSLTGALGCDDSAHLLQTLTVEVLGVDPAPSESSSWSQIKQLFGVERSRP